MIATWPITNLPIPAHIVVIRGIWLERAHLVKHCDWIRSKLSRNDLTVWQRKFFTRKLEETTNALERA